MDITKNDEMFTSHIRAGRKISINILGIRTPIMSTECEYVQHTTINVKFSYTMFVVHGSEEVGIGTES